MILLKKIIIILVILFSYGKAVLASDSRLYVCPMHSHIKQTHAANCPICGMSLIINNKVSGEREILTLSNKIKQVIDLTTENVRYITLRKEINSGIRLGQLSQPYTEIVVNLLKPNMKWLKKGRLVELTAGDYVRGERTWHGKITSISAKPNAHTHLYTAKINVHTPYNILTSGMYVSLTLYGEPKSALVIPFNSVITDSRGIHRVMRVVGKNQYQPVPIKIGIRQDHLVEVLEGLDEHDKVVNSSQFLLYSETWLMPNGAE